VVFKYFTIVINITDIQQEILKSLVSREITDHSMSGCALIMLLTTSGEKRLTIANILGINSRTVAKWKKSFVAYAIDG
jgi:hypothetical protein